MNEQGVEIVRELPIQDVLKQPEQRKRLFKILIQTLSNIGYKEAAKMLEKESDTAYFDPNLEALQASLEKQTRIGEEEVALVDKLISGKDHKTQDRIRLIMLELLLAQIARQQPDIVSRSPSLMNEQLQVPQPLRRKEQHMLEKLEQYIIEHTLVSNESKHKLNALTTQLVFEPNKFKSVNSEKLFSEMVDLIDNSSIEKRSMERIIRYYADSNFDRRGGEVSRGQDFYDLHRFSLVYQNGPSASELPVRLLVTHDHETKYEITQIAINKTGRFVVTVGTNFGLQESELCMWNFNDVRLRPNNKPAEEKEELFSETATDTLKQIVTCVAWNHELNEEDAVLAAVSRSSITLFNRKMKKLAVLSELDALCCKFNPITNFLYTGGLNNHQLRVWDSRGQQLDTYRTGPTRSITFSKDGTHMYLVSSSSYQLTKMDTADVEKLAELSVVNHILDCICIGQTDLLVCSSDKLYLLKEANLQIIRCFELQGKNSEVQYYSYVREWGNWFVVSGSKNFRAFAAYGKSQVIKWRHNTSYPVFECFGNIGGKIGIVSSKGKHLCFWSMESEPEANELLQLEEEDSEQHLHSELEEESIDEPDDDSEDF